LKQYTSFDFDSFNFNNYSIINRILEKENVLTPLEIEVEVKNVGFLTDVKKEDIIHVNIKWLYYYECADHFKLGDVVHLSSEKKDQYDTNNV